jgi:CRP/FNR family cyclic AMP-dependent transcriptional regulator
VLFNTALLAPTFAFSDDDDNLARQSSVWIKPSLLDTTLRLSAARSAAGAITGATPVMKVRQKRAFDVDAFLGSAGAAKTIVTYRRRNVIFSQGDASNSVLYIQQGVVKLSVLSKDGKAAVVAMLGAGDFFGERALTAHPVRLETATAMTATTVLIVPKQRMIRLLHHQHAFSDRFIAHMLARNIRIEQDLVDQLFNSSEKRLARTLLLLARDGKPDQTRRVLPRISQETLADMIGTTRSRVNFFMNKFKKLGFIEYNGGLKVNHSLLTIIVHD